MRQLRCCRHQRVSETTAGSRQPLLVARRSIAEEMTIFAMHKRTPRKSGERQPAVGLVTQLRRRSCTDDRRIAPARQLRCCRYQRVSETTAGLRQPLLVARTHTAVDARLRPATALCFARLAYASRSWFVSRQPCSMCVSQCHQTKSMSKQASVGSRAIGAFLSRGCAVHTTVGLRRFLGQPG